jgi:aminoglycoside phosphotransferase (APT) family kinase protein
MKLPAAVPIPDDALAAIRKRFGLPRVGLQPFPHAGIINSVYVLGNDLVLRVPRNHPAHVAQAYREATTIPLAVAAGVQTPALVAFDDALDILPVPYLIVERVPGVNYESLDRDPHRDPEVWGALGRDLARLHAVVRPQSDERGQPDYATADDPRRLVEHRVEDGWLAPLEGGWLQRWLDRLEPLATRPVPPRLTHADVQMSNVLVDPDTPSYLALIDWGCAHWNDAAFDFLAMPLEAVPFMLAGHREVAPLDEDEAAEARILWRRIQLLLSTLPRGAAKDLAWGERPVTWLVDLLRFFLETTDERWKAIGPAERL